MVGWLIDAGFFSKIYVVGISGSDEASVRRHGKQACFIRLKKGQADNQRPLLKALQFASWFIRVLALVHRVRPVSIHPHSLSVLPVAVLVKLAYRTRLVYEAHELETEVKTAKGLRRMLMRALERSLISFADEVIVVSERIADWYQQTYSIPRPKVVRNVPEGGTVSSEPFGLRHRLKLPDNARIALYLGAVAPGRRVEWVMERWNSVPRDWHFVIVGDGPSLASCRHFAKTLSNVHFHSYVSPSQVIALAREADIGFCMLDAACLSYKFSLPNKFFEYAMAGVPIVANELPEVAALIRRYDAGWVLADDDDLDFIAAMPEDELRRKAMNTRRFGMALSWRSEVEKLRPTYEGWFGSDHGHERLPAP